MARVCVITGKKTISGNNVSHANNRTKRKFYPNLQRKRFYVPEDDRWVTLRVSTSAIRTINKKGIGAVLAELQKEKGIIL
ncbi:MAG: 50S ribosomal protein L28 [Bacteroidia bacterium]|nr:50S ribosomal protein L28 [Bacteroidia bacterium]